MTRQRDEHRQRAMWLIAPAAAVIIGAALAILTLALLLASCKPAERPRRNQPGPNTTTTIAAPQTATRPVLGHVADTLPAYP